MADYGLTVNGFVKKPLVVIKEEFEDDYKSIHGEINVDPASLFGQEIGVISEAYSKLWERMEEIAVSGNPHSAEGFSLDNISAFTGIFRLAATSSFVTMVLLGDEGTLIPAVTTQFKQVLTSEIFINSADVTITEANIIQIVITPNSTAAGTYTVNLDSTPYSHISPGGETKNDILTNIQSAIGAAYDTSLDTDNEELTITVKTIDELKTPVSASLSAFLDYSLIGTPGLATAQTAKSLAVAANSVNIIETPVSGLTEVNNLLAGTIGRDLETDTALRLRRRQSTLIAGGGSIPAMEARILQEVSGVTACNITDNRTDITDGDGRPPHSFEAVILGGADQDIFDKLWSVGGGGIETYGNQSGFITDSQGVSQVVKFSRPVSIAITVNVEFDENTEETLPTNYEAAIKAAILEFALEEQTVSDDVTVQRYATPIYTIPGVGVLTTLEMNRPSQAATSTLITIAAAEIATFDLSDITVTKN